MAGQRSHLNDWNFGGPRVSGLARFLFPPEACYDHLIFGDVCWPDFAHNGLLSFRVITSTVAQEITRAAGIGCFASRVFGSPYGPYGLLI